METTVKLKKSIFIGRLIEKSQEPKLRWERKMTRSLDESIVMQAIRDLVSKNHNERFDALEFFLVDGHNTLCQSSDLDAKAIKEKVIEAVKHDGVRRQKLVKDLLRDLPRY
jgi:hypothetical protein